MRLLIDANLSPNVAAALSKAGLESVHVVLLRSAGRLTSDRQAALLTANLPAVADDLEAGAIVTIARGRMRIRSLPIVPAD